MGAGEALVAKSAHGARWWWREMVVDACAKIEDSQAQPILID